MFERVKQWYNLGFWNETMVKNAVTKKLITKKECDEILKGE